MTSPNEALAQFAKKFETVQPLSHIAEPSNSELNPSAVRRLSNNGTDAHQQLISLPPISQKSFVLSENNKAGKGVSTNSLNGPK